MTILAVSIRAFVTDPQAFTRIREDSRMDSRGFADGFARIRGWIRKDSPRFPRIPQDSPRIYADSRIRPKFTGFARIYGDSRNFATDIRRFADGFTQIRESSWMDIRGFAQDSHSD